MPTRCHLSTTKTPDPFTASQRNAGRAPPTSLSLPTRPWGFAGWCPPSLASRRLRWRRCVSSDVSPRSGRVELPSCTVYARWMIPEMIAIKDCVTKIETFDEGVPDFRRKAIYDHFVGPELAYILNHNYLLNRIGKKRPHRCYAPTGSATNGRYCRIHSAGSSSRFADREGKRTFYFSPILGLLYYLAVPGTRYRILT